VSPLLSARWVPFRTTETVLPQACDSVVARTATAAAAAASFTGGGMTKECRCCCLDGITTHDTTTTNNNGYDGCHPNSEVGQQQPHLLHHSPNGWRLTACCLGERRATDILRLGSDDDAFLAAAAGCSLAVCVVIVVVKLQKINDVTRYAIVYKT